MISAAFMAIPDQWPTLPDAASRSDWWLLLAHAFSTGIATLLIYKSQQMISAILVGELGVRASQRFSVMS